MVYGDDVVLAMNSSHPMFSRMKPEVIQQIMKDLGYTIESADSGPFRWTSLKEVTFLKRYFVRDVADPTIVHAPRELADVWTQLMWRRADPTVEAQECCFRMFAAEIGQHPKSIQDQVYRTMQKIMPEAKKLNPMLGQAWARSNFKECMEKSYRKELCLEDLLEMRNMFWRLW